MKTQIIPIQPKQGNLRVMKPASSVPYPVLLKRSRFAIDGTEFYSYRKILLSQTDSGAHIQRIYNVVGFLFSTIKAV